MNSLIKIPDNIKIEVEEVKIAIPEKTLISMVTAVIVTYVIMLLLKKVIK